MSANAEDIKTTYQISRSSATVTTAIAKATPAQEKLLSSYLFELLAKNLKQFHGVVSVEVSKRTPREESLEDMQDSQEFTRKYPVQVKLELPGKVTLAFDVEESFTKCKSGYACTPTASLRVVSRFQQDVSIDVVRDTKESMRIVSVYNLNSIILGGRGNVSRNTIMVSAARALRVNNEKMIE
ncbi:MAG: hypothetical protein ACXVA9_02990 [Bdellovibrionales bacterium]